MFEAFMNSWQASLVAAIVLMIPAVYFLRSVFVGRSWNYADAERKSGPGWLLGLCCVGLFVGQAVRAGAFLRRLARGGGWSASWNETIWGTVFTCYTIYWTVKYSRELALDVRRHFIAGILLVFCAALLLGNAGIAR